MMNTSSLLEYFKSKSSRLWKKNEINLIDSGFSSLIDSFNISLFHSYFLCEYIHSNGDIPKCQVCNKNHIKFRGNSLNKTCSKTCSNLMAKKSLLKTYSGYSEEDSKNHSEKIKKGVYEKYGVENVYQSKEIKEKIKKTNLEKYGVDHHSKTEHSKQHLSKNNPLKNEQVKEKIKKTNLEKYGVENVYQSKEIKEKIKKTTLEKYGSSNYSSSEISKSTRLSKDYNDCVVPYLEKCNLSLEEDYTGHSNFDRTSKEYSFRCLLCQYKFSANIKSIHLNSCKKCFPKFQSSFERDIIQVYSSKNIDLQSNTRKIIFPYEIDIMFPSKNLAVEVHGLYYHSAYDQPSLKILKDYHLQKYQLCKEKGIHLLQFFENELIFKKDICYSIINSNLGIYEKSIYARKCIVKEIPQNELKQFLNCNHIQGFANSSINLGLFHDNELCQVMTFSKPRYSKKHTYELIRLCSKLNTKITGGSSKLFSHFVKNYLKENESIISYCDNRFFLGESYKRLSFVELKESSPNYFYWNYGKSLNLYNRSHFQKHKLKDLLSHFDPSNTEFENMLNNKYRIIFDAGNKIFEFTKTL